MVENFMKGILALFFAKTEIGSLVEIEGVLGLRVLIGRFLKGFLRALLTRPLSHLTLNRLPPKIFLIQPLQLCQITFQNLLIEPLNELLEGGSVTNGTILKFSSQSPTQIKLISSCNSSKIDFSDHIESNIHNV